MALSSERQRLVLDLVASLQSLRQLDATLQAGDATSIHKAFTDTVASLARVRSGASAQTEATDVALVEHVGDPGNNNIDAWLQQKVQVLQDMQLKQAVKVHALETAHAHISGRTAVGGGAGQPAAGAPGPGHGAT